jgi:glycosyltransferase involved in cell wall biosynthesis
MPTVSVIVPTHNRPEFLSEALASVRTQTFTDYETIVISNGETDDMRALSRACAVRFGCTFFALPDGNVSAARNFGIKQAKGEWIAFLDDDDIWLPAKLERQLAAAHSTKADMITASAIEFRPNGSENVAQMPLGQGWTYVQAICHERWSSIPSAVIVRKSALLDVGGFDPSLRCEEDSDLWRRLSWRHTIHQVDEPLLRYRMGHGHLSGNRWLVIRHDLRHFLKMLRDTPPDLRWAMPSPVTWIRRWLIRSFMPRFLRQPRKQCLAAMEMFAGRTQPLS